MHYNQAFAVISAERPGMSSGIAIKATRALWTDIQELRLDAGARGALGIWQGNTEASILVPVEATVQSNGLPPTVSTLLELGRKYRQEAILYVNAMGEAVILDAESGAVLTAGRWQQVTDQHAAKLDGLTVINGKNFTVIPYKKA